MILLDTHVLIWVDIDDPTLGKSTRRLIAQAWEAGELAISSMSFWECAVLHVRQRIVLPKSPLAWRADLLSAGLVELSIDGQIGILATELDPLHKDPADRLIAASAITHSATLVTADERLLKWKHAVKRQNALR
ncbi:MAG: type II toxin-antitoxin system VapC family toxin [Burkholderiales bacterium]